MYFFNRKGALVKAVWWFETAKLRCYIKTNKPAYLCYMLSCLCRPSPATTG